MHYHPGFISEEAEAEKVKWHKPQVRCSFLGPTQPPQTKVATAAYACQMIPFWLSCPCEQSFIHLILLKKVPLAKCAFDIWIFTRKKKKSGNSILGCSKPSFCKVPVGSNALELRSCISECKATLAFGRFPVWPRDWLHPNKGLKTRSSILMSGVEDNASQILHCPANGTKDPSRWGDIRHSCSQPTHIHGALVCRAVF